VLKFLTSFETPSQGEGWMRFINENEAFNVQILKKYFIIVRTKNVLDSTGLDSIKKKVF